MKILKTNRGLQNNISKERNNKKSIGFVPTMGALHDGHMSLIQEAQQGCDVVVVSIFVNPTQFNEKSDLEKYPRPIERDTAMLKEHGVDYLFLPSTTQIYPKNLAPTPKINLGQLATTMEGEHRPGHFEGVIQVVHRLLTIVSPDQLYMGQKDFQQFTIIQAMLNQTNLKTQLRVCPIHRQDDGLAMSSRNARLSAAAKKKATAIYESLMYIKNNFMTTGRDQLIKEALEIQKSSGLDPEYIDIADGHTLQSLTDLRKAKYVVACTASWLEGIRLIDNMILRKEDEY